MSHLVPLYIFSWISIFGQSKQCSVNLLCIYLLCLSGVRGKTWWIKLKGSQLRCKRWRLLNSDVQNLLSFCIELNIMDNFYYLFQAFLQSYAERILRCILILMERESHSFLPAQQQEDEVHKTEFCYTSVHRVQFHP